MRRPIAISARLEECDIRLGLPPCSEDQGVLHPDESGVCDAPREELGEGIDAPCMRRPDRRHLDDLPVEQFVPLVLAQHAQRSLFPYTTLFRSALEQSFRHTR